MMEEQNSEKPKREEFQPNSLVDIHADQQEITLSKLKSEEENAATNDANGNAPAEGNQVGGDSRAVEGPNSEQREESATGQSPTEGS